MNNRQDADLLLPEMVDEPEGLLGLLPSSGPKPPPLHLFVRHCSSPVELVETAVHSFSELELAHDVVERRVVRQALDQPKGSSLGTHNLNPA